MRYTVFEIDRSLPMMDSFFSTIGSIHIGIQASNRERGRGGGLNLFVGAHSIINYRDHRHHGADTDRTILYDPSLSAP